MTITLPAATAIQPLKPSLGQGGKYLSTYVALDTPYQQGFGPRSITVTIPWSDYGAGPDANCLIDIDLASGNPQAPLDKIRSIFIDNSFSFTPIYVLFPDTQFTAICPANSIACIPVLTNQATKALVFANDFNFVTIPTTTIHFTNINQAGWVIGTGAYTPPVTPPSIVHTANAGMATVANVANFGSLNIGVADATREVFVAVSAQGSGAGVAISSVTVGGSPAAAVVSQTQAAGGISGIVAIYRIAVAAGTTAAIVVNTNQAASVGVNVYAVYNLLSNAPHDTGAASGATLSFALDTPNDGVAIAAFGIGSAGTPALPTGIQNTGQQNTPGGSTFWTQRGYQTTSGGQFNIGRTASAGVSIGVAASYG